MRIAVVILNWNGKKLLEQFLPSILEHSASADIYVADNASADDSVHFLTLAYPTVRIIQNTENYGFAQGYNEALKHIDADVYALINSDIEVTANWLQPIINEFERDKNISIIQPKILDYKRKNYFEYAGAAGGFLDKYGYPFCRGRVFDTIEEDLGQYDTNENIFWASGACFFIKREVFFELGEFDADFFAHQEEIDLCWRAINKGHKIRFVANSVVFHVGGATLDASNPRKTYLNFRNSLLMMHKNLPSTNMYGILLMRMIFDGIAGIRFLFHGKPRHTYAIINAHFSFYKNFSKNKVKRGPSQSPNYYHVNNLIFHYFVKRLSTYNKLI